MAEILNVRPLKLNKGDEVDVSIVDSVSLLPKPPKRELQITRDGDLKTALSIALTRSDELGLIRQLINYP